MPIPEREAQILQMHAPLIVMTAQVCLGALPRQELDNVLVKLERMDQLLVAVIRRVLAGEREESLLNGLDEDDRVIVSAILLGIQDPATLPDPSQQADPVTAAPGLAAIIHAAAHGDVQALQIISEMAEQMTAAGGEMARTGGVMRKLVDGERDVDVLSEGMGAQGASLMKSLVEELGKLAGH